MLQTIQTDTQSKLGALKVYEAQLKIWILDLFIENANIQEQQQHCTIKLQQTNNLIKFCIEALKESDSIAFLQVNSLHHSTINAIMQTTWILLCIFLSSKIAPISRLETNKKNGLKSSNVGKICSTLTDRVTAANAQWHEDENTAPRILSVTNLTLDDARVKQAINNLCFADAVRKYTHFPFKLRTKTMRQSIRMRDKQNLITTLHGSNGHVPVTRLT